MSVVPDPDDDRMPPDEGSTVVEVSEGKEPEEITSIPAPLVGTVDRWEDEKRAKESLQVDVDALRRENAELRERATRRESSATDDEGPEIATGMGKIRHLVFWILGAVAAGLFVFLVILAATTVYAKFKNNSSATVENTNSQQLQVVPENDPEVAKLRQLIDRNRSISLKKGN